ncbi:xylulokinase [Fictibacillus fluitans]|uniref:Xylulose kinase n=1 Tax=Fictibacillus fluitans TaxID=3058422 RepID=A0ABT8HTI6_9BACL|nr:xylulokinase [Fictibacillus sp. NE201]MDN4524083.1 xylulokinase [Fictibacillus sp. NE201]
MNCYLGIDLGTSSLKVLLVNSRGEVVSASSKAYPIHTPSPNWMEQNPSDWIAALKKAIAEIKENNPVEYGELKSIGMTGQMHGIVPVDQEGGVCSPAIIWSDQRNEAEAQQLKEWYSTEQWVDTTGNQPNISFSLGKIMWYKRHYPDLYQKTDVFLLPKDYIRMYLTGSRETDYTDGSATLMMDLSKREWSDDILSKADIEKNKLPSLCESTKTTGQVTKEAAMELGLAEGVPVVCGCGDAQAQAIGNGVMEESTWLCTIGTSGQLFVTSSELFNQSKDTIHTLCHPEQAKWAVMGATLSAGASLSWLAAQQYKNQIPIKQLMDEGSNARKDRGIPLFWPYLAGERTPYMDSGAKGAFIGFTAQSTRAETVRGLIEGVVYSLYHSMEYLKGRTGCTPERLVLSGGATLHPLWGQVVADVFGIPVHVKASKGGAALGAAMLAAVGVKDFPSLTEVMDHWELDKSSFVFHPDEKEAPYHQKRMNLYITGYGQMKEIFNGLHGMMEPHEQESLSL